MKKLLAIFALTTFAVATIVAKPKTSMGAKMNLSERKQSIVAVSALAAKGDLDFLKTEIDVALNTGNSAQEMKAAVEVVTQKVGKIEGKNFEGVLNSVLKDSTIKDVKNIEKKTQSDENKIPPEAKVSAFPVGNPNDAFAKYFTGKSYLAPLTVPGECPVFIANVTFEPGCRNNWHVHRAKTGGGQILICVGGRGWYQEEGKPAQALKPGDVVTIPANVKHWHGAASDSWFSHLAVEVPGTQTSNEWLEAVSDAEYGKLKVEN